MTPHDNYLFFDAVSSNKATCFCPNPVITDGNDAVLVGVNIKDAGEHDSEVCAVQLTQCERCNKLTTKRVMTKKPADSLSLPQAVQLISDNIEAPVSDCGVYTSITELTD